MGMLEQERQTCTNTFLENHQIRVSNIPQIINDIEKRGFDIDKNEWLLCSVPLLILDDFGIERNTEYINEMVYQIINTRYEAKKPTIISTNIPLGVIMSEVMILIKKGYIQKLGDVYSSKNCRRGHKKRNRKKIY